MSLLRLLTESKASRSVRVKIAPRRFALARRSLQRLSLPPLQYGASLRKWDIVECFQSKKRFTLGLLILKNCISFYNRNILTYVLFFQSHHN